MTGMAVVDWLDRYGTSRGYEPNTSITRNDFSSFVMKCGVKFESWVIDQLVKNGNKAGSTPNVVPLCEPQWVDLSRYTRHQQKQHLDHTLEALGDPATIILYQPFVVDDVRHWFGHPDLVIRQDALPWLEDILHVIHPDHCLTSEYIHPLPEPVKDMKAHPGWAIVDIKYSSTLTNKPLYQAQLLIYMMALNSMIGNIEPVSVDDLYLLGRKGELTRAFTQNRQVGLVECAIEEAREWLKQVDMNEAMEWKITPTPSVRELQVQSSREETNFKWDKVLDRISKEQGDVCSVYKVGPVVRSKLAFPPLTWWNPLCTAKYLGVAPKSPEDQLWIDHMLTQARRARLHEPTDSVKKLSWTDVLNGSSPRAVRYKLIALDFEFVYDLHLVEAFNNPKAGASSWIFSVSAGVINQKDHLNPSDLSHTLHHSLEASFTDCVKTTTGELSTLGELEMMERWLTWMQNQQQDNCTLYVVHWSPAEPQCLKRVRAKVVPGSRLSDLFLWWDRCVVMIDLMNVLIRCKVVIPGAMEYGLKAVHWNLFRSVLKVNSSAVVTESKPRSKPTATTRKRKTNKGSDPISTVNVLEPPLSDPTVDNGLNNTGLAGDMAGLIAYELASQKRFGLEPDEAMKRVMDYNHDDVQMTASVWLSVVQ
jgi:hypothetical protein